MVARSTRSVAASARGLATFLSRPDRRSEYQNAWSGNGQSVAFQRTHSEVDGAQIFVIPRNGGTEVAVTEYGESCTEPDWNPVYDAIAFHRGLEIYARKPDGTDEKQLTFNHLNGAYLPAWSEDGNRLAWVDFFNGHYAIFAANVRDILIGL